MFFDSVDFILVVCGAMNVLFLHVCIVVMLGVVVCLIWCYA